MNELFLLFSFLGNEGKVTDINMQDAISSEALKTAMKDSDLTGLSQIKNELDLQDAKNTVDFFDQPTNTKPLKINLSSANIGDLSEQIKEAEAGIEAKEEKEGAAAEKTKSKGDEEDPQKVKIILHIPESISKEKGTDANTQETLDLLTEQAKAFLTTDQAKNLLSLSRKEKQKVDETTLETAKKIEEFIKEETKKKNEENTKVKERINSFAVHRLKDDKEALTQDSDENLIKALLASGVHDISFHPATVSDKKIDTGTKDMAKIKEENHKVVDFLSPAKLKENSKELEALNSALKETPAIKEMPDPVLSFSPLLSNPRPTLHALEKFIKTTHEQNVSKVSPNSAYTSLDKPKHETASEPVPLRINGGKVLGGNVRGGNILGGTISGGDVSGGEIRGGTISGGTYKNGLFLGGEMKNGVVEGGIIRGGLILGGDIKSGEIDNGTVTGGIIEGGHLVNGSVEGGDFKGGTIMGGRLLSGEIDGGTLKNGTVNGGILKGGVIESGELNGGIMFAGVLRGGIVKSGIIRGGTIDKGVIVQDAEIGPGVEIHDGIVKGGRITVNSLPAVPGSQEAMFNNPSVTETYHTDENRSNIMYSIEVLPKPTEKAEKADKVTSVKDIDTKDHTPIKNKLMMMKPVIQQKKAEPKKVEFKKIEPKVVAYKKDEPKKVEVNQEEDNTFLEKSLRSMSEGDAKITDPNKKFPTPRITRPVTKVTKKTSPDQQVASVTTSKKYPPPSQLKPVKNAPKGKQKVNLKDLSDIKKLLKKLEASSSNKERLTLNGEQESNRRDAANAQMYAAYEQRRNEAGNVLYS